MVRMTMSSEYVSGIGPFQLLENFRCFCGSVHQNAISGLGTGNYVAISVAMRIAGGIAGSQRTPIDLNVFILCYTREREADVMGTKKMGGTRRTLTETPRGLSFRFR
jgi:hypothetical protein